MCKDHGSAPLVVGEVDIVESIFKHRTVLPKTDQRGERERR